MFVVFSVRSKVTKIALEGMLTPLKVNMCVQKAVITYHE